MKIAIHGKASSGKGTAAEMISRHLPPVSGPGVGFLVPIRSLADPIKETIEFLIREENEKYKTPENLPNDELFQNLFGSSELRNNKLPDSEMTCREACILLGRFGRKINPNFWINKIIKESKHNSSIIIPDVRFKNEFEALKKEGFIMIKINRNQYTKIDDESETDLDEYEDSKFDFVIDNNGNKKDLKLKLQAMIEKIRDIKQL